MGVGREVEGGGGMRAQELYKSRGPGSPVPNSPYGLCGRKATLKLNSRAQELCESRGGRPGFPVLNSPYGLCGRKATLNLNTSGFSTQGTFNFWVRRPVPHYEFSTRRRQKGEKCAVLFKKIK